MLIHIVPRLYNNVANTQVEVLDVTIQELGLLLRERFRFNAGFGSERVPLPGHIFHP